ncbi:MAG: flagellar motor switch protein FliN [Ignavibacteriae bacterium]|nr:flagellar motor switch protein FliN [Ignavibacteriota bacterium]
MEKIKEEEMLKFPQRSQSGDAEKNAERPLAGVEIESAQFQQLDPTAPQTDERERKLDLLMGISLPVAIELGRTELEIRSILDLKRGSIIEFDRMASEPVDIVVNGKKMAEGEVVVIDKHFAIRVTALVETSERIKGLGK